MQQAALHERKARVQGLRPFESRLPTARAGVALRNLRWQEQPIAPASIIVALLLVATVSTGHGALRAHEVAQ
jgi:hypothetical protein